ncbi:hypothetical protein V6N12_023204 [Hibiscus sabdariffa]|uniref:Uncharacterized protein n=1 Tax=Hibiscus sabdariffa TaxID=183260 RepID=A0ABR2FX09_9ROSI
MLLALISLLEGFRFRSQQPFFFTGTSTLMKITSIKPKAFYALILLYILLVCSSLSLSHGEILQISRKMALLSSSSSSSLAAGKTQSKFINGAIEEEPKKAVEPSLREAPTSASNPTQN